MAEYSAGELPKKWKSAKSRSAQRHKLPSKLLARRLKSSSAKAEGTDVQADQSQVESEDVGLGSSGNTVSSASCSDEETYIRPSWRRKKGHHLHKNAGACYVELQSLLQGGAQFVFQKRQTRIDWRTLHVIDVDQLVREVDIDKLETILDTITFGDIQGEDTRNFTEQNFIKLFRLSQLIIEYLLYAQEILEDHKSKLLAVGTNLQKHGEKLRLRCLLQRDALKQGHHELKHVKKTLKTYEILLRATEKQNPRQEIHHCGYCEKIFESSHYLDLHISRRHSKSADTISEDKIAAIASKAEESTAARVKAETAAVLDAELQRLRAASLGEVETAAYAQVASLRHALKDSNSKLHEVQKQLGALQSEVRKSTKKGEDTNQGSCLQRLRDLESKFEGVEYQLTKMNQENLELRTELHNARSKVLELHKQNQERKKNHKEMVDDRAVCAEIKVHRTTKKSKNLTKGSCGSSPVSNMESIENDMDSSEVDKGSQESDEMPESSSVTTIKSVKSIKSVKRCRKSPDATEMEGRVSRGLLEMEDEMPAGDKDRWIKEHPYAPIPEMRNVLAHRQDKIFQQFQSCLIERLQNFGISPDAEGLSNENYATAIATLERQRAQRLATAPALEKRNMEYERSTILWHIERAVHTRDMDIIESILDDETPSGSDRSNQLDPSDDDSDGQDSAIERTNQTRLDQEKISARSDVPSNKKALPDRHTGYVSETFSWKSDQGSETQGFRISGEVIAERVNSPGNHSHHKVVITPITSPNRGSENEDEQAEANLGLGDWESDEEGRNQPQHMSHQGTEKHVRNISPGPGFYDASQKGAPKHEGVTKVLRISKQTIVKDVGNTSRTKATFDSDASDGSKMLEELDAEIDEIIKM